MTFSSIRKIGTTRSIWLGTAVLVALLTLILLLPVLMQQLWRSLTQALMAAIMAIWSMLAPSSQPPLPVVPPPAVSTVVKEEGFIDPRDPAALEAAGERLRSELGGDLPELRLALSATTPIARFIREMGAPDLGALFLLRAPPGKELWQVSWRDSYAFQPITLEEARAVNNGYGIISLPQEDAQPLVSAWHNHTGIQDTPQLLLVIPERLELRVFGVLRGLQPAPAETAAYYGQYEVTPHGIRGLRFYQALSPTGESLPLDYFLEL